MWAKERAEELGVFGSVQNCPDGTVCIEAEGEQEALDVLVTWCQEGPSAAEVERVDVTGGEQKGYESFDIWRTVE